jgi:hypothetical protein
MIEVRTSEVTFAPSDVRRYISRASVERRLTWPEVALLGSGENRKLTFADSPYLLTVLSPEFALTPGGLFLHGMPPHGIVDPEYAREHGRSVSEGLNNHVHLADFTKSRVAQFEIGVRAIRQWIHVIAAMPDRPNRVTLYLDGSTQFTICVYSEATAADLDQLDRRIGGKFVVRSAETFLAWAFPLS